MATTDGSKTTGETVASPFELPAMSDAYPLDSDERRTIDDLLSTFAEERAETRQTSNGARRPTR